MLAPLPTVCIDLRDLDLDAFEPDVLRAAVAAEHAYLAGLRLNAAAVVGAPGAPGAAALAAGRARRAALFEATMGFPEP